MLNISGQAFKVETAMSEPESLIDDLSSAISKMSQALILHTIVADHFLSTQMARPVAELHEEGFFDDVAKAFSVGDIIKDAQAVNEWSGNVMGSGTPNLIRKSSKSDVAILSLLISFWIEI